MVFGIEDNIIHSPANGRTFTMYRYNETFINGTKSNPSWYGDLVGDWREEVILPDQSRVQDLKIFSTWYPTTHKFPWLMADHTYWLSALNENIGYNQPTNLGYYLGTDLKSDAEAWEQGGFTSGILSLTPDPSPKGEGSAVYDLSGRKVMSSNLPSLQGGAGGRLPAGRLPKGIYIQNGKKFVVR